MSILRTGTSDFRLPGAALLVFRPSRTRLEGESLPSAKALGYYQETSGAGKAVGHIRIAPLREPDLRVRARF